MQLTNIAILILSTLNMAVLELVMQFDRRHHDRFFSNRRKPASNQFMINRNYNHSIFSNGGILPASLLFLSGIVYIRIQFGSPYWQLSPYKAKAADYQNVTVKTV